MSSKLWKEQYKMKRDLKVKMVDALGFEYREVGDKLNYGVFHDDIKNGEKLLGWIRKYLIKESKNGK